MAEIELKEIQMQKPLQLQDTQGNQLESSLIKFAQPFKDVNAFRHKFPIIPFYFTDDSGKQTFDIYEPLNYSNLKYSEVIRDFSTSENNLLHKVIIKGAPEFIWLKCDQILVNGELRKINVSWIDKFIVVIKTLVKNGEQVLAFANKNLISGNSSDYHNGELGFNLSNGFTFIGLVGIKDPLRKNVSSFVAKWKGSGRLTKTIMITEDRPEAAAFIAKSTNIFSEESKTNLDMIKSGMPEEQAFEECDALVIDGEDLTEKLAEQDLQNESTDNDNDTDKKDFLLD